MSKQPYIYTLPEQFLDDSSVPTHWRLWALINGFFISGKPFYATNDWIGERLGVKQWAISTAFTKLEELKLISCKRSRNSRVVTPYGSVEVEGSDKTLPTQCPTTISDSVSPLHNSDSNSESRKAAKAAPSFSVVSDSPSSRSVKKDPAPLKLREKLYDMFSKEHGARPSPNWGDYKRVEAALKHLTEKQVIDLVEDALEGGKPPKTVREALTDRSIDSYRYEHA